MGILNSNKIKTRKIGEDLEVFERVGRYEIYEPDNSTWQEIIELFKDADQSKMEDGQYVSSFSKTATIQLFRLLTNVDMTEKLYDTYSQKRNVRLQLVQQYLIEVVQTYLKLGMAAIENEKLSEDLGVEKPKNRNDKTVILDEMRKRETERKAQEAEVEEVVETDIDGEIAELEKKLKEKKREELLKQLAELEG